MRKVLPYPLTFLLSYVTFDSVIGPYLRQISSQIEILILLQWKTSWKKITHISKIYAIDSFEKNDKSEN